VSSASEIDDECVPGIWSAGIAVNGGVDVELLDDDPEVSPGVVEVLVVDAPSELLSQATALNVRTPTTSAMRSRRMDGFMTGRLQGNLTKQGHWRISVVCERIEGSTSSRCAPMAELLA
jgi:hypothetical protein